MLRTITLALLFLFTLTVKGQVANYEIKNIEVNNKLSNFGTTFYGDGKVVYASPKKQSFIFRNVWEGNNQPFLDLFIGDIAEDGELINVEKFSDKLNTRYHEADVAFTKDKKTVYFSRNNYYDKTLTRDSLGAGLIQLYRAKIAASGEWVDVEPMHFNNDHYQTGHPTLSADETMLYFISDMPGTLGKTDVFKATISADGTIGEPINLGPQINTPEREMFSSISGNDELYFSSDGRKDGLGELDVYVTKIRGDKFTEPLNIGAPINSAKDDFAFILNYETRRGYFSSNRDGGHGDDDIYTFNQKIPLEFECNQIVKGTVTDKQTHEILVGALVVLYDDKGEELGSMLSDSEGLYSFEVTCNKNYKLIGSKEGYNVDEKEFYSTEGEDLEIPLELLIEDFIVGNGKCIIKINPIYFDFDKSYIRPDAEAELNKVVDVMNKYPELIIEGGSHTDSRAPFKYNEALSSRRAKQTVKYIISKGIDPRRISSKGYGERELVNGCSDGVDCSEEAHQFNRRTEFVVVNYDEVQSKYPNICNIVTTSTKDQIEEGEEIIVDPKLDVNKRVAAQDPEFMGKDKYILIRTNSFNFDLNASEINADGVKELRKVVEILTKYSRLKIEVGNHTDSRASAEYNEALSTKRATAITEYLVSKGISSNRITTKGYGESKLTNHCSDGVECSDKEHNENRRTEFVILNPEVFK